MLLNKQIWLFESSLINRNRKHFLKGTQRSTTPPKLIQFKSYQQLILKQLFFQLFQSNAIFFHKLFLTQQLLSLKPNLFLLNQKFTLILCKLTKISIFNKFQLKHSLPQLKLITFIRKGRILLQYFTKFYLRQKTLSKGLLKIKKNKSLLNQPTLTPLDLLIHTHFFTNYKLINFFYQHKLILLNQKFIFLKQTNLKIGDIVAINLSTNILKLITTTFRFLWKKQRLFTRPIIISTFKKKKNRLHKMLKKSISLNHHLPNVEIDYSIAMICYIYPLTSQFSTLKFTDVIPYNTLRNLNWKYYF